MEQEKIEKIMSRFQSFAMTPGSLHEIENFFVFQSNYRADQKRLLRYNLLIQCDDYEEMNALVNAIKESLREIGIEDDLIQEERESLAYRNHTLDKFIRKKGILFITGCEGVEKDSGNIISSSVRSDLEKAKREKVYKWNYLVNTTAPVPNLPIIACGNKAFVDFVRESDEFYYRFFAHHVFLRPIQEDEVIRAVFEELEKDGFSTTEAFEAGIETYIRTVYVKADLKGRAFVKDLINRIEVNYYLKPADHVVTKRCVPFYRKTPSFETIISRMNQLVGLEKVKEQFYELYKLNRDSLNHNKIRLHFAFVGNPGTGKSTVAALTANLLYAMGLIKKNKIVTVTAADIVGMYLGQWVVLLKEKIAEAQGGVLFIDEAYFLIPGWENSGVQQKQCLNVLIQEMENNSDNISVIFAGYEDEIDALFRANEGIYSRVPYRFQFDDYTDEELMQIFQQMAARDNFSLDEGASDAMMSRFALERAQENFGNARSVANIYQQVRSAWMDRAATDRVILEEDIRKTMPVPLYTDLDDMIGLETVKQELNIFESRVRYIRHLTDNGVSVPAPNMHMMFTGNPGTGKTTVAKKIADCLYHIGVLKTNKLVSVERKDLVSTNIGGTAKRTNEVIQKALNGVLFIDEAYALYRPDDPRDFGSEVIDTLITAMEKHKGSLVVIFAGYRKEMMVFRRANSGITSRIGFSFDFPDYSPDELTQIYFQKMKKFGFALNDNVREPVFRLMEYFSAQENFGNGRFVDQVVDFTINKRSLRTYRYRGNDISPEDIPKIHEMRRVVAGMHDMGYAENLNDSDRIRTAIHEAGHALVSRFLWPERELKIVSIRGDAASAGRTGLGRLSNMLLTEKTLKAELAICFGGRNAERLLLGDLSVGSGADFNRAREIARQMVREWAMGELGVTTEMDFLKEADQTATRILSEHREQLEMVSQELARRNSLTGEEVEELLQ